MPQTSDQYWSTCLLFLQDSKPDLLDWKTGLKQAEVGSWVTEVSITKDTICSDSGQDFYLDFFPGKLDFDSAVLMCYNLGGHLFYPKVSDLLAG